MEPIGNTAFARSLESLDFDRIAASLSGLAQHQRVTKKSVVRQHLAAIETALSRRVGYEAVARTLTDAGCAINAAVLRRYVWALRAELVKDGTRMLGTEGAREASESDSTLSAATTTETHARAAEPAEQISPATRRSLRRHAWLKTTNEVEDGNHV